MTFNDFKNLFYQPKEEELRLLNLYRLENPNNLLEEEFEKIEKEMENKKENTISDQYLDFKLWYAGFPSREESFAEYLINKLKGRKCTKILNVGCGRKPVLSEILENEGYEVYNIDPKLEINGRRFFKMKFNYNLNFAEHFDLVIGQEPCEATEHIIRYCDRKKIPFYIVLCGVPHDSIDGEKFESAEKWYEYLEHLSENIEFEYPDLLPIWEQRAIFKM